MSVLVEDDVRPLVNVSAVPVHSVEIHEEVAISVLVVRAEKLLESIRSFPSVVMRDLGRNVVADVRLADAVKHKRADKSQTVSVNGGQGTSGKVPLLVAVVRNKRVGVLQERDRDQPVVDVEVRNEIIGSDLGERAVVSPSTEDGEKKGDSEIRCNDLLPVSLVKDNRVGVEMVGEFRVVLLSRGVSDEVHRPAEELLSEQVSHHEKWGIADGLGKFELSSLGDVEAFDILFALIESGVAMLVSGAGNENLITSEVTGSSVMSAMRDSPAVVRNTNGRMKNPSNGVVDGL